jgi:hypothetical protein
MMPPFSPELIGIMRAALEGAMTKSAVEASDACDKGTSRSIDFAAGCQRGDERGGIDYGSNKRTPDHSLVLQQ